MVRSDFIVEYVTTPVLFTHIETNSVSKCTQRNERVDDAKGAFTYLSSLIFVEEHMWRASPVTDPNSSFWIKTRRT